MTKLISILIPKAIRIFCESYIWGMA